MNFKQNIAVYYAILAAFLFGLSAPVSKLLLVHVPPTLMAALLYLGAGIGMTVILLAQSVGGKPSNEASLDKKQWPFIVGMIVLDIGAPILLMFGLTMTTPENAALLGNFEIVATALIALLLFKEAIGRRLWIAIGLITLACAVLSINDSRSFSFSLGSIMVLLAGVCWGLENNCTRVLSLKNPLQIVLIKGLGSGLGALVIAIGLKEFSHHYLYIAGALLLGFFAFGLSIFFYVCAQRRLGAARTSAYYAFAPFIGVGLSFVMFSEPVGWTFFVALTLMVAGAYYAAVEKHKHQHLHSDIMHEHRHNHADMHHDHTHDGSVVGEHSHLHAHKKVMHEHDHTPDLHHTHSH